MATTLDLEFEKCLQFKKIREFSRGKSLVNKELESAKLDLKSARETFEAENYKWSTIQCYYSMFHSARALLYAKSYREKSHQCLIEAIRAIYLEKGLLDYTLVEALQKAKTLREEADYYGEFSKENAGYLVEKGGEFLKKTKEVLKIKKDG